MNLSKIFATINNGLLISELSKQDFSYLVVKYMKS